MVFNVDEGVADRACGKNRRRRNGWTSVEQRERRTDRRPTGRSVARSILEVKEAEANDDMMEKNKNGKYCPALKRFPSYRAGRRRRRRRRPGRRSMLKS